MGRSVTDYFNKQDSESSSERAFGTMETTLTFCVVTGVDAVGRTCTIKHTNSSLEETGIPYLSSTASSQKGEDFIPSRGDIGVVATMTTGTKIILGFMGGANRSGELLLKEGDMLFKSLGNSFIKQDVTGNVMIVLPDGSHMLMDKEGNFKSYFNSEQKETDVTESFTGIKEFATSFTKYFLEAPLLLNAETPEKMILLLSQNTEAGFAARTPIFESHRGTRLGEDKMPEKLIIENIFGGAVGSDLCYSDEVYDEQTLDLIASIKMDKLGRISIEGTEVQIIESSTNMNIVKSEVIQTIASMTQAAYDAMPVKNPAVLYLIIEESPVVN